MTGTIAHVAVLLKVLYCERNGLTGAPEARCTTFAGQLARLPKSAHAESSDDTFVSRGAPPLKRCIERDRQTQTNYAFFCHVFFFVSVSVGQDFSQAKCGDAPQATKSKSQLTPLQYSDINFQVFFLGFKIWNFV